jgi:hypothetical protein
VESIGPSVGKVGEWCWQAGLWVVLRALFLTSSRIHPTLLMARERLPHSGTAARSVRLAYMNWCGKRTWHVDPSFPYRVYIDLNRRDSQI